MARIISATVLFLIVFVTNFFVALDTIIPGPCGFVLPLALYLAIYILVGYKVILKAIRNICRGELLDENFLMAVATLGAFALGIYRGINGMSVEGFDEACAVLLLYQIGEMFQDYATDKARDSITKLMDLRPDFANLKVGKNWQKVDPNQVKVGDIVLVKPGEKIALDGVVVEGTSNLDTKALTGEALPRLVNVGDTVLSGCVNLDTQILVKVTKAFYDSTANKILDLVENASNKKARTENFITKFARIYTPVVVGIALVLAIVPSIITGAWALWIYRALSFLVVSCPCALVISIPLSFFVAIGTASKFGILVKGANYLEKINQANLFVFDKTGTLTKGNFVITKVVPESNRQTILLNARIAEQNSNHPIAQSIMAEKGDDLPTGFIITEVTGAGVIARQGKEEIHCGSAKLLRDNKIEFDELDEVGTVVYVARNRQYLGAIVISDEIRPETQTLIQSLGQQKIRTMMLTGDNQNATERVAKAIGVNDFRASMLPQDKAQVLTDIMSNKNVKDAVCFVGDGINDAPVLAMADVGVAMGGVGSDVAIESADIVLMHDDLRGLNKIKAIARKTMRIVKQNIFFALLIKVAILVLSAVGITNMWFAVFGDVGVAVLTILNALRISNQRQLKKHAD